MFQNNYRIFFRKYTYKQNYKFVGPTFTFSTYKQPPQKLHQFKLIPTMLSVPIHFHESSVEPETAFLLMQWVRKLHVTLDVIFMSLNTSQVQLLPLFYQQFRCPVMCCELLTHELPGFLMDCLIYLLISRNYFHYITIS